MATDMDLVISVIGCLFLSVMSSLLFSLILQSGSISVLHCTVQLQLCSNKIGEVTCSISCLPAYR